MFLETSKVVSYQEWCYKIINNVKVEIPYPEKHLSKHTPKEIVIHHTWSPSASAIGEKTIQGINNYHINVNKWIMGGYHDIITNDGLCYEMRNHTHKGAHVGIYNNGRIGICVVGNYDVGYDTISKDAYRSLVRRIADICAEYEINPENIKGHCDYESKKTCPGTTLYKLIPTIIKDVKYLLQGVNA